MHAPIPLWSDLASLTAARFRGLGIPYPDVLIGGTPCQAFSVAGERRTDSLNDSRANITLQFIRLANEIDDETTNSTGTVVVWENVTGVLHRRDNPFGHVMARLSGHDTPFTTSSGTWTDAGMVDGPRRRLAWRVLNTQYFGLPQHRRRVFCIAVPTSSRFDPGVMLFEYERHQRHTAQTPTKEDRGGIAKAITCRLDRYCNADNYVIYPGNEAGEGAAVRSLSVDEAELLQGFPAGWTAVRKAAKKDREVAIGNAMSVPVIRWIGERIIATLGSPFRFASVCSGIEAASLAWTPLGCEPVLYCENGPFPRRVLQSRLHATPVTDESVSTSINSSQIDTSA